MSFTKLNSLRLLGFRSYSCPAGANAVPIGGLIDYEVASTSLPNKLVVVSGENECPISRIAILYRAGSRFETHDEQGAAAALRICAGISTKNATQFAIMRNIQQVGARVSCSADREVFAYSLEGSRHAIETSLPFLTEMATQHLFKPWEVSDNLPRLVRDTAERSPQAKVLDLVHKAAYRRGGLANSVYCPKHRLGKICPETLQHFVKSYCTPARAAVLGLGVDHTELVNYSKKLEFSSGGSGYSADDEDKSPYIGGEIRLEKGGPFTHIAVAVQGAPLTDTKSVLALEIIKYAFGMQPKIKWNAKDNGVLSKALGQIDASDKCSLDAFSLNYSDSGLFGVLGTVSYCLAGNVIETIVKQLKVGKLSDADFTRAKNQLKLSLYSHAENGSKTFRKLSRDAVILGSARSVPEIVKAVDGLLKADVDTVMGKLASSKISMATLGDLHTVPYLDEIAK